MNKKERTTEILKRMDEHYGTDLVCYLEHEDPWQLLIATILSAQCTDARVNMVTPELFRRYPTPKDLGEAKLADVEEVIHSVGFYHNKAKNIIACSRKLWEEYGGTVPHGIELLTELPGVGRKTANVIRGNIFHEPSIVVDTHVGRISRRLGLTKETEPVKVEFALMKELPKDHWILWNLQGIALGREICKAPTPNCSECFLQDICPGCGKKIK